MVPADPEGAMRGNEFFRIAANLVLLLAAVQYQGVCVDRPMLSVLLAETQASLNAG
jgi:hypothetical protein